jgi:hypothetical protein
MLHGCKNIIFPKYNLPSKPYQFNNPIEAYGSPAYPSNNKINQPFSYSGGKYKQHVIYL